MKKVLIASLLITTFALTSCKDMSGAGKGALIGGASGAVVGGLVGKAPGAIIGGAGGALIGAAIGDASDKHKKKKKK